MEKYFEEKGIEKLKGSDWKDVEYKEVKKSVDEKKLIKPLEYLSASQEWDKEEGPSKAKSRIRNIIVFNENRAESVDLEFSFDDYLRKEYIYKTEGEVDASTSGKKLKVTIKDIEGKNMIDNF